MHAYFPQLVYTVYTLQSSSPLCVDPGATLQYETNSPLMLHFTLGKVCYNALKFEMNEVFIYIRYQILVCIIIFKRLILVELVVVM